MNHQFVVGVDNMNTSLVLRIFLFGAMSSVLMTEAESMPHTENENVRQFMRSFLKIPYYLSEKYVERSPVFFDSKETTYKELLKHVLRKRNVYDTITGSRDLTSSHAANGIHQAIQRLRQLQRLENKHRRFLHGAPVSIGLALPVLSRNINLPVPTSTK